MRTFHSVILLRLKSRLPAVLGLALMSLFQSCNLFGSDRNIIVTPVAGHGYFSLSAPAAGASLNLDSAYTILWSPTDSVASGNVRISLYQDDRPLVILTDKGANTGSYLWRPSALIAKSHYQFGSAKNLRILIASAGDTAKADFSGYFSTYSDYSGSIAVTTPGTGDRVRLDSTQSVRWTPSGDLGPALGIQLYRGADLLSTLTVAAPASGYYLWTHIDTSLAGFGSGPNFRLRVFSVRDPSLSGFGPTFSIVSAYGGTYNITPPAAGDTLEVGKNYLIVWEASDNPGPRAQITLMRDSLLVSTLSVSALATDSLSWKPSLGMPTSDRYRIRVASLTDPGLVGYSAYFVVKGVDPDEYEMDDSVGLAKVIPITGEFQQHTLPAQDSDWLTFTVSQEKRYLIDARSTLVNLDISIFDSIGGVLLQSGSGKSMQALLTPKYSGNHCLRVTSGSGFGPYRISVSEYDSTQSTSPLEFSLPDQNSVWAAGSAYTVQFTPDSLSFGSQLLMELFLDTALTPSFTAYVDNSGKYAWTVPAGLFSSNRYRLRISSFSNSLIAAYSPYFTISGLAMDAYEPDNAQASAKKIEADGKDQARNLTPNDVDWIRIDGEAGKQYLASIKSSRGTLSAYLVDRDGLQLKYQTGTQFSMALHPANTGAYYLRLQGSTTSTADYAVSLVQFDSAQGGFPVNIQVPDTLKAWASGTATVISWKADQAAFGASITIALYLDTNLVRTIGMAIPNNGSYTWNIPAGMATSSHYRIRMASQDTTGVYGFSPAFSITGLRPDEYEADNSRAQAKTILTDGLSQKRTLPLDDTDWVVFNVTVGKSYLISTDSSLSHTLTLYDSLGVPLDSVLGIKASLKLKPTGNGRFFLRVRFAAAGASYTLSVLGYVVNPLGLPIDFAAPIASSIWSAGAPYNASWTPDTILFGAKVNLALYLDSVTYTPLAALVANSGSYTVSLLEGLPTSNHYRLKITHSGDDDIFGYSPYFTVNGFPLDSLEPNDVPSAATAFALNTGSHKLSLNALDRDWFQFNGQAGMLYTFLIDYLSISTTIQVYSGLGVESLVSVSQNSKTAPNILNWICTKDGVYSAMVEPYGSSKSGSYSLEMKERGISEYGFVISDPVAGQTERAGEMLAFIWSDPADLKGLVDIHLYDATGKVMTITSYIANTGRYIWTLPADLPPKSGYYIKVVASYSTVILGTSQSFTVLP